MKIVLIHYHLKPGGVTTVLHHQIKSIPSFGEVLVLTGEAPAEGLSCPYRVIPGIAYDATRPQSTLPLHTAKAIVKAINEHWPEGCDLIHVHNPTLAKNQQFLQLLEHLQAEGINLFLQIHDFAEEGRPHAYFRAPYPKDCHYGVINARDYDLLLNAGIKKEGLHLIPNAVNIEPVQDTATKDEECVLYPVRAIRRKNIGEAALLSLFFPATIPLKITLPPNSSADIESYQFWKTLVLQNGLNIEFEAGVNQRLATLIQSARFILTTSIMEGFGFSLLEPWLSRKAVWGRYLVNVCPQFEQMGMDFSHLYHEIKLPSKWIDTRIYLDTVKQTLSHLFKAYGKSVDNGFIDRKLSELSQKKTIDFGDLNERFQSEILIKLLKRPAYKDTLIHLNPFLSDPIHTSQFAKNLQKNADLISTEFSIHRYTQTLKGIYETVTKKSIKHEIDKTKLLLSFINLDSENLLKWGSFR